MFGQTILGCFIIIRCHQQYTVCTVFFCLRGQIDCRIRTVRTGSCNDRYPFCGFLNRIFNTLQMFLMGKGRRFSGCSANYNGIRFSRYLLFDQFTKFIKINASILIHRCDNCNSGTCKYRHNNPPILSSCFGSDTVPHPSAVCLSNLKRANQNG